MINKDPYNEIAKEYPIIITKPFFNFAHSLYLLKNKFIDKGKHERNIR